jgi:hypothetical protein
MDHSLGKAGFEARDAWLCQMWKRMIFAGYPCCPRADYNNQARILPQLRSKGEPQHDPSVLRVPLRNNLL